MIDWQGIDNVFLDMDGTLLDLHFDNHFWMHYVPDRYAREQGISPEQARTLLYRRYRDLEGTLSWYCVDHWSRELGLDIALLKEEVDHLIQVHPHVVVFLEALELARKARVLVTNAHQKAIDLKMERTRLAGHFDRIVCAHELGVPKEHPEFWHRFHAMLPFDPERTLFVDDNPAVLAAARRYGIRWLLAILKPDTREPERSVFEFEAIRDFSQLMPLP
jgi:HAD superfamily hydrolase (TIGR01509 family)